MISPRKYVTLVPDPVTGTIQVILQMEDGSVVLATVAEQGMQIIERRVFELGFKSISYTTLEDDNSPSLGGQSSEINGREPMLGNQNENTNLPEM